MNGSIVMLKKLCSVTLVTSLFSSALFAQSLQTEAVNLAKKYKIPTDKLSIMTVKIGDKKDTLININADRKLTIA